MINNNSLELQFTTIKESLNSSSHSKSVKFNPTSQVILIPSRYEYLVAGIDPALWWGGEDYLKFQQSAHSEILLMSSCEKIDMRAARRKLYQPNPAHTEIQERILEACSRSQALTSVSCKSDDYYWDDIDNDSSENVCENTNMINDENESTIQGDSSPSSSSAFTARHNDSIGRRIKKDSLSNIPFPEDATISTQLYNRTILNSSSSSFQKFKISDEERNLVLCVPLKEPKPVNFDSRPRFVPSRVRVSIGNRSLSQAIASIIALGSAALLAIIVIIGPQACANILSAITETF